MRIRHWLFILVIISAPVAKAYDGEFIDEHFAQDSVLVLLNGAVASAALEFICHRTVTLPGNQGRYFCLHFPPEATTFLYLIKSQWSTGDIKVWSHLNMAFFAGTSVCIISSPELSVLNMRLALVHIIYLQVAQMMANTAFHYLAGSNQTNLTTSALTNGISTGLIMGGFFLWYKPMQALHYRSAALLITTVGTTLISTFFYFFLQSPSELISALGKVKNITVRLIATGVVAKTIALALVAVEAEAITLLGAEAEAIVIAIALLGAAAEAAAEAGAAAEAAAVAVAGAGITAGITIIALTGSVTAALPQAPAIFPASKGLATIVAAGLPLMVTSWLASLNRFVEVNATAHETMQSTFIPSLPELKIFYPENWMNLLQVLRWFTD